MVETLRYQENGWDVALPTVKSYNFTDIKSWKDSDSQFPLVLDTNLVSGCNVNCMYCSTEGGKQDVRWKPSTDLSYLTDRNLYSLIEQLADAGTKTFFICSNGEPLLNKKRFLGLANKAKDEGVSIVTYTNGSTLDSDFLEKLCEAEVSLIMKWESSQAEMNDNIILNQGSKRKNGFKGFEYEHIDGLDVPAQLSLAQEIYGPNSGQLGIETMITAKNIDQVVRMREFCYDELNSAHFLKHLYDLGHTAQAGCDMKPAQDSEDKIRGEIMDLDTRKGFKYPDGKLPDNFSYDARRLMNNLVSKSGFPFRMFIHEIGGIYHNSQIVPVDFGFGSSNVIPVIREGEIDFPNQLKRIGDIIKK